MKPIWREFDEKAPTLPLIRELRPKATVPSDVAGAVIDFRSSDETVDRYNEVIVAGGWKLDNYRRNPVVQNAHRYYDVLDTIGKSVVTEVRGTELFQRVEFAVNANPVAKVTYDLYKGGFLNAVSVGFIPKKWENGSPEVGYRRKYIEQELLEVSAVGIPANPNALKLALDAGAVNEQDLKELSELLQTLCYGRAGIRTNASAPGPDANGVRLLQLTREVASLARRA